MARDGILSTSILLAQTIALGLGESCRDCASAEIVPKSKRSCSAGLLYKQMRRKVWEEEGMLLNLRALISARQIATRCTSAEHICLSLDLRPSIPSPRHCPL